MLAAMYHRSEGRENPAEEPTLILRSCLERRTRFLCEKPVRFCEERGESSDHLDRSRTVRVCFRRHITRRVYCFL